MIMPEFGGYPEQKWIEIQEEINNEMHLCKNVGVLNIFVDLHWGTANLKTENSPRENLFKLSVDNWQIRPFDYRFFKSRLFAPKSISGKYLSYMMMPEGLHNKWKVFTYILFNGEVFKLWETTGQKVHPLTHPFYILYWGLTEIIAAKRRKI